MRRPFRIAAFALTIAAGSPAAAADLDVLPKFADYPVRVYRGTIARPRIAADFQRDYKIQFEDATTSKIDAAGHYVVAKLPCGSACAMAELLDARSGRIINLFSISGWREVGDDFDAVESRADSRLIVFHGARNETGINGNHYYLIRPDGTLKHLRTLDTGGNFETAPKVE
ncbi:hypothetical protein BH11PSE4_BH11PSE4_27260 [soil metagenome]